MCVFIFFVMSVNQVDRRAFTTEALWSAFQVGMWKQTKENFSSRLGKEKLEPLFSCSSNRNNRKLLRAEKKMGLVQGRNKLSAKRVSEGLWVEERSSELILRCSRVLEWWVQGLRLGYPRGRGGGISTCLQLAGQHYVSGSTLLWHIWMPMCWKYIFNAALI
jgi:hypothetical protein